MTIAIVAFLLLMIPSAIASDLPIYETLSLPLRTGGPESIAFDLLEGGPYTGISNGRIVKYVPLLSFIDFAFTAQTR